MIEAGKTEEEIIRELIEIINMMNGFIRIKVWYFR